MARFEGKVTEQGWYVLAETGETGEGDTSTDFAVATVEKLAQLFIQAQTALQAEGQRFIRQTLEGREANPGWVEADREAFRNGYTPYTPNHSQKETGEEIETISDGQVPELSP